MFTAPSPPVNALVRLKNAVKSFWGGVTKYVIVQPPYKLQVHLSILNGTIKHKKKTGSFANNIVMILPSIKIFEYVIVIVQLSGIYGSKRTESEGGSPRARFVYVAINP